MAKRRPKTKYISAAEYYYELQRDLARCWEEEHRREEHGLRSAAGNTVKPLTKEEAKAMALKALFESEERARRERER
jgi:hypothetical protein